MPHYILPEFTVRSRRRADFAEDLYQVREVYPSKHWDPQSLVLTAKATPGIRAMAVLRFGHDSIHSLQVDVAVGFSRILGRWQAWALQFQPENRTIEGAYHKINQSLPDFSPNTGHSLPTTATVEETQLHGRPYILLEVTGKPEIGDSVEITNVGGGQIPSSIAADMQRELEEGLERDLSRCSVPDSLEVSLFPGKTLTAKVRVLGPRSPSFALQEALQAVVLEEKWWVELVQLCKSTGGTPESAQNAIRKLASEAGGDLSAECNNFHLFEPLHFATAFANETVMELLLKSIQDSDELINTTEEAWTIAHIAAILGETAHIAILKHVIDRIEPSYKDLLLGKPCSRTAETPLHFAAAYAPPLTVGRLINVLLDLDENEDVMLGHRSLRGRNYLEEIPLHRACAMGNLEAVKSLVQFGPESITDLDKFGRSAVWHAACAGHAGIIRLLVQWGVFVDLADDEGRTPLYAACREGHADAVEELLDLRANPEAETSAMGLTPAHVAALFGHTDCLLMLLNAGASANKTPRAAEYVNFTPIHLAAANGHSECVSVLLQAGADAFRRCSHYVLLDGENEHTLVAARGQNVEEIALARSHREVLDSVKTSAELTYDWGTGLWKRKPLPGGKGENGG